MKNFKQFLNENKASEKLDELFGSPDKVAQIVAKDCKPFLEELGYPFDSEILYRGMTNAPGATVTKNVRKFREPKAMVNDNKEILEKFFNDIFGHSFRSESLFAIGELKSVEKFGRPYIVFPIGEYRYLWSPEIEDINIDHKGFELIDNIKVYNKLLDKKRKEEKEEEIKKEIKNLYQTDNIKEAAKNNNEIMIVPESGQYHAIDFNYLQEQNIIEKIKDAMLGE